MTDDRAVLTTLALASILLLAGLAGCIGSDNSDGGSLGTTSSDDWSVNEESHCVKKSRDGTVNPQQSMSQSVRIDGSNVTAAVHVESFGAGEIEILLDRDGQEVWGRTLGGNGAIGDATYGTGFQGLGPGTYTLTLSTETGYRDVSTTLRFEWGTGSCEDA